MDNIFLIEIAVLAHRAFMACGSGVFFTEIFRVLRRAGFSEVPVLGRNHHGSMIDGEQGCLANGFSLTMSFNPIF